MGADSALKLVIVMPAYNEAECIEKVARVWINEVARTVNELLLIVVNDGSLDQTGAVLDRLAATEPRLRVIHQPNGGHGSALLTGYRAAVELGAPYTFQVDSDDQFLPRDFRKLWERRNTSKFVMGYRKVRHDAFHRLMITRVLKLVILGFFGAWVEDANIPYRLIQTAYLKRLLNALPGGVFAPNIFLTVLAAKDGQDLGFIPVTHEDRKTGVVSIVRWKLIKFCLRSVRELLDFRLSLGKRVSSLRSESI